MQNQTLNPNYQLLIDNVKDRNVIKDLMEPSYICKKD